MTANATSTSDYGDTPSDASPYDATRHSRACVIYEFLLYTVLVGLICIAGIIGNLISFVVFWRDTMKTSTNFLLQSLSLIDIALLVTVFPIYCIPPLDGLAGWYADYKRVANPIVMVYGIPLAFIAQTATVWVTVLVAVNRYIAICWPFAAPRLCTVSQARRQLAVVLTLCALYNVPKFFEGQLEVSRDVNGTLTLEARYVIDELYSNHELYTIIYGNVCYVLVMLLLPLVTLSALNVSLIRALSALRAKRAQMQSARQQQDNSVTLVLVVVILVFSFCQSPALVTQILWNVLLSHARTCGGFQFYFSRISNLLVITNSAVNFVIYFVFNKRFRHVLLMTCRGRGMEAGSGDGVTVGGGSEAHMAATRLKSASVYRRDEKTVEL